MIHDLQLPKKQAWQGSEDALQIECAAYAKKQLYLRGLPQVFHHCPNGGRRTAREAAKFKLMGVLKGVFDTFLPLRSGEYAGLYIELKNAKGSLTPEQIEFGNSVSKEGFLAIVVNDLQTFKECYDCYLNERA